MADSEYLPKKTYDNREYLEKRNMQALAIRGNARISNEVKKGLSLNMHVESKEITEIEMPLLYYIGYSATLKNSQGTLPLSVLESANGFVSVSVPSNSSGELAVSYKYSVTTVIGLIITILSLVGFIYFIWRKKFIVVEKKKQTV